MSTEAIAPEPVPLVRDEAGRLMVPGTRISLDVLVADFKRGETPASIHGCGKTGRTNQPIGLTRTRHAGRPRNILGCPGFRGRTDAHASAPRELSRTC